MGFLDSINSERTPSANPANPASVRTNSSASNDGIREIREVREGFNAGEQSTRLRWLAAVAGCRSAYVDRLHPAELAEYARYPDADAAASLLHLGACIECQARQCRPVSCSTDAQVLTWRGGPRHD